MLRKGREMHKIVESSSVKKPMKQLRLKAISKKREFKRKIRTKKLINEEEKHHIIVILLGQIGAKKEKKKKKAASGELFFIVFFHFNFS